MAELHDFLSMLTKNLGILEERARRYSVLPKEQLQTLLQPHMKAEQEKIQSLEGKERLDSTEQRLLAIHHHNLELYQQILTGERPYAPLELLNQINDHYTAIDLTERVIDGEISVAEWREGLELLLIAASPGSVINISIS
jgi:hypothetical protein